MIRPSVAETPAVFIAAEALNDHALISNAADQAFDDFKGNSVQIDNNVNGGAGYFAETHHAASFNVNQANAGLDEQATLVNSREFGSVDIQTDAGIAANPKFYSTAEQSYSAGAILDTDSSDIVAKYAGQQIIVPQDQLSEVLRLHQQHLDAAYASGDTSQYNALSSISFSDHVVGQNGVGSTPLTYQEAQFGTEQFRHGTLPDYAHNTSLLGHASAVGESTLLSVGLVSAIELAPALVKVLSNVSTGEVALNQAGLALIHALKDNQSAIKIQQTAKKAAVAGGLTFFTSLNAGFATFLVTFGWDVKEIYQEYQQGLISQVDMYQRIKNAGINRGVMSSLTMAAVSVAGPIGLLAPILAQWLIENPAQRKAFEHGLNDVFYGWMRTVNQSAQITSQQWQLTYNVQLQADQQIEYQQEQNTINSKQLDGDIQDFDKWVKSDDLSKPLLITSGEQHTLSSVELLKIQNLLVLEQSQQHTDIHSSIERFIIEHGNNKRQLERAALDALVLLDSEPTDKTLQATTFLKNLNQKILEPNQLQQQADERARLFVTAQLAAMRMLQSLQNDQKLSMEFITLLQQRINGFILALEKQQQQNQQSLRKIYQSMALVYGGLRNSLVEQQQRIDALEKNIALQEWLNLIHAPKYKGQSLQQLNPELRLSVLLNDFILLTEGRWTQKELLILQEMLYRVQLEQLGAPQFIHALLTQHELKDALFQHLKQVNYSADEHITDTDTQFVSQLYQGVIPEINGNNQQHWTSAQHLSSWDMVLLLLWHIQTAGITPYRMQDMDKKKLLWLSSLEKLEQLIEDKLLAPHLRHEIDLVKQAIIQFKLVVPFVGKFSVGKSTLLNTWFGQEIQPTDLAACTSVPTEFHYSEFDQQKMILVCRAEDGVITQEILPVAHYPQVIQGQITPSMPLQHIELHLHLSALAQHPDLILVDTPGLESTVGSHEQALRQYSGTINSSFILCASRMHVGEAEKQFVLRQGMFGKPVSLLVCQEDLILQRERQSVRETIALQAEINPEYGIVRGCSAHTGDLKGLADLLNHIEEQKDHLFEQAFQEQIKTLIALAHQNLEQQLSDDHSHEQLRQQQQSIALIAQHLKVAYEKQRASLLNGARGHLASQVTSTISQALTHRETHYFQLAENDSLVLSPAIHADIQNTFELAVEQMVFPVIRASAEALEIAVMVQHEQAITSGVLIVAPNVRDDSDKFAWLGGIAGGAAGMAMGAGVLVALPLLVLPAAIFGGIFGAKMKQEKIRKEVYALLEQITNNLQTSIPERLTAMVQRQFEQIYDTLMQRLAAEQDRINAIDRQLELDQQSREALRQKLAQACAELEQLTQANQQIENKL